MTKNYHCGNLLSPALEAMLDKKLAKLDKFGLDGVLYSMPLSDILTFFIAAFLICQTYKELSETGANSKPNSRNHLKL